MRQLEHRKSKNSNMPVMTVRGTVFVLAKPQIHPSDFPIVTVGRIREITVRGRMFTGEIQLWSRKKYTKLPKKPAQLRTTHSRLMPALFLQLCARKALRDSDEKVWTMSDK